MGLLHNKISQLSHIVREPTLTPGESTQDAPAAPPSATRGGGEPQGSVVALRRGLSILDVFSKPSLELGVNELARMMGLHKSTVSRLCLTLEAAGFLKRDESTQRFSLGPRVYQLAGTPAQAMDLRATARPVLDELVASCRETASLTVVQGYDIVTIDVVDGLDAVRMNSQVGSRVKLHASAGAKALLAWMPESQLDEMLARNDFRRFTANTLADADELKRNLAEVRERGYSEDLEEIEIGLRCVAAPVRDHEGKVLAGVSLSGPRHRMTPEVMALLGRLVVQSADAISARLGAPPPQRTRDAS